MYKPPVTSDAQDEDNDIMTLLAQAQPPISDATRRRIWQHVLTSQSRARPDKHRFERLIRFPLSVGLAGLLILTALWVLKPFVQTSVNGAPTGTGISALATVTASPTLTQRIPLKQVSSFRIMQRYGENSFTYLWYQAPDLFWAESYNPIFLGDSAGPNLRKYAMLAQRLTKVKTPPTSADPDTRIGLTYAVIGNKDRSFNFALNVGALRMTPARLGYDLIAFDPRAPVLGTADPLGALLKAYGGTRQDATLLGEDASVLGRKVWIIDGYRSDRARKYWVDQETLIVLKEEPDVNSGILDKIETLELELNPTFPEGFFTPQIAQEDWASLMAGQNESNQIEFDWQSAANRLSFTPWVPAFSRWAGDRAILTTPEIVPIQSLKAIFDEAMRFMPSNPCCTYSVNVPDGGTQGIRAFAYSAADPTGPPILELYESTVTNTAPFNSSYGLAAAEAFAGHGVVGSDRPGKDPDQLMHFSWDALGTRIVIRARTSFFSKEDMITLAKSLRPVNRVPDAYSYLSLWRAAAACARFVVSAPGVGVWFTVREMESGQGSILTRPDYELTPGVPTIDGFCSQIQMPFYKPGVIGIAAMLTETRALGDFTGWERIRLGDYPEAYFKTEGKSLILAILLDGALIRIEGLEGMITRDDLIRLGSVLRKVEKTL